MVAPGMIAPLESFTVPVICAFWANAGAPTRQREDCREPDDHSA